LISLVAGQYNAHEVEEAMEQFWKSSCIYSKVRRMRLGGRKFFFVDGPPYTTGRIHLGTAWNKVIKDSILRYNSMHGADLQDRAGWDMHGLPIEVKVEEHLGFKSKKEIEIYGVERFIEQCKSFANRQKDDMTSQFKTLGVWLNWEDPYMTLKNEYIEAAWWALKKSHERGLLERGQRVVNWCPRCETAIADSEVEYWDERDPSIYVRFPVIGEKNTYIVIWTTTPWTIPANIAVAVHTDFEYSKVRAWNDERVDILIMASDLIEQVLKAGRYQDFEVIERLKGTDLLQLKYDHPLNDLIPAQKGISHNVYFADFVTAENTGCVHIAPGHGIEDYELGMQNRMPIFCPVGENGRYTEEAGEKYVGKYVREANEEVMGDLLDRGLLLAASDQVHRYGHCWRCKTPIIFIATRQWFLRISDLKGEMLDEISKIKWYPDWAGSARFKDWISNARDWCISRQRYWGIPLPIWICSSCGALQVIGTAKELRERSGNDPSDLHRPGVDPVKIPCSCGGTKNRVPDVFDVWFDSAVASWATLRFPAQEKAFEEWWPADFITEGHDQTRGWFYSQLGASMVSFGKAPYRSVLMHGFTLDEQGRKMSKSIGNVVSPEEVVKKYGADTLRFYVLSSNAPWEDLHFSWDSIENVNRMLNILWNAYRFPLPYMVLDGFDVCMADLSRIQKNLRPEDRWILSRVNSLSKEISDNMAEYNLHRIARAISDFVLEDLSRWYIQLVRPRTWIETDDPDKLAAYAAIYNTMATLCKLLAPFVPFIAESMYQNLVRGIDKDAPPSVHMCDWPAPQESLIDKQLEESMSLVRELSEAASNARQRAGRKLRWPVNEILISSDSEINLGELEGVLKAQTNAKKITVLPQGTKPKMDVSLSPVHRKIGPVFKGEAKAVVEALAGLDATVVKSSIESLSPIQWKGKSYDVTSEMVEFHEKPPANLFDAQFSRGSLYVDVTMTPELKGEGYSREIIRRIQDMRKELDLKVEEQISSCVQTSDPEFLNLVSGMKEFISKEIRASDLVISKDEAPAGDLVKDWDVEGLNIRISIKRA
jgi:isoleucyl-tRNA synthetase